MSTFRLVDSTPAVCAVAGLALAGSSGAVAGGLLGGAASARWGVRPSTLPCAVLARAKRELEAEKAFSFQSAFI